MGFMDKVVFDEVPSGKFSNNIQFDTITSTVLNPSGGLTVPQGFVDGAATNQNLHKPTPPQGTLGKALTWLKDAAVDMSEYALTAPATTAAGVNRGLGSLQTAFSYAPQSDETVLQYDENLGFYEENPLGLATLRQHDEAGVQAGISRMDDADLVMKQIESEKPMDTLPGRIMRKGLFQVSNMAPTMAMAAVPVVGPDAALMAMSMSSGADPIKKARDLNLDDAQTADYIAKTVGPEYLGEKASFGTLLKALGGKQPFVKTALQLISTELGGEIATSHFQFAADKAYEQPGLTREQRDKIYNDIVTGKTLQADGKLRNEWLDVMKDTAEGVAGMVGITAGGGKLYRKAADRLQGIPSPTRKQLDTAEQQQKQDGIQNDYNRYFEQQGYGPTAGLNQAAAAGQQQQAAAGTGQTAAPGGEQGAGQFVAGAPAAAEQTPVSQADYELQAAAELAAQQPVEDDIPDFTPPTTLPQQAAAVAPAVQSPAQPVGTLTKAAQVLNPYSQLATTPFAQAPDQQPVMPDAPVVRGAGLGLNTLQAPGEQEQALAWAEQQLANPATSRFERQNLQTLAKSPGQVELVRYWRAFQNRQQQPRITPAAGGLTMPGVAGKPLSLAPTVARDSATLPAVPAVVAPAEVQQSPAPAAVATSSMAAGGVDQNKVPIPTLNEENKPIYESTPASTLDQITKTVETDTEMQPPALSRNSKGNIDLKFTTRPDDAAIQRLTEAGFKFNQKQKVWYAGDVTESVKLAEELAGTKLPAPKPKKKTGLHNFLTEIKEAGGIKPQSLVDVLDKNEVNGGRWLRVKNKSGLGVDQMAIRMHTDGWPVPVDVDGNPDTDAFAQLLKDAVNGNPPVHPDNADKAVAVQLAAELDQISQLTDEDYELQSLLGQDLSEEDYRSLDDLVVDLFDELSGEDYGVVSAAIKSNLQQAQQIIQEVENGQQAGSDRPDNADDQGSPDEDTTGEAGGSGQVSAGPAGKSPGASGGQTNLEVTPLYEVPQNQVVPDMDADRTAADPRTSLPSLDDFSKLFDEMAAPVDDEASLDEVAAQGLSPREQGAAAFAADAQRMAPADLDTKGKTEWYQGYDRASLDAPLPEVSNKLPLEVPETSKAGKPRSEVVSKSGEEQVKLFATPPTFGKKPQTKGKAVDTGALLDDFTDTASVQPDMFSTPARPSAEDSKAAIRAILAAKNNTDGPLVVKQSGDDLYRVANDPRDDETYLQLRPHILNLWQGAQNGDGLAEAVPRFITSLLKDFGADIKPYAETFYKEILNGDILEVAGGTEDVDNQRSGAGMERNSQPGLTQPVGTRAVQSGRFGSAAASLRQRSEATREEGNTEPGTAGVSGRETAAAGEGRDSEVQRTVVGMDGSRPTGTELNQRSSDFVDAGVQVEPITTAAVDKVAERNDAAAVKREQQRLAQKIAVVPGDLESIRQSLPILLPGQDTDVQFAETRFAKPDGYGVLFTNGTGTGKTFSGLGIIKRFERQGKKDILIIAPQDNVIKSWIDAGRLFQLDITTLKDTNDAGSGIVITTFANFGTNSALASRNWDLVVADEAQYLNSNKSGGATKAQSMLRAITLHPDGAWQRSQLLNAELFAKYQAAHEKGSTVTKEQRETITARWREVDKQTRDAVAATKPEDRTRVLFLSATPFAYHKSIDYANGYLFDYNDGQPKDEYRGYNSGSNYDRFFMTHFGYRMRVGKLTEPPAEVNVGLMERMFNSWLKKNGVLSGRMLAVEQDYDRKFVLVDSAIGRKIDEGLEILRQDEYRPLQERVWKAFDYLHRRFLLEAIKAKEVIPHIKEHIAMGRKVLVFHDYNQGGGINPFDVRHLVGNGEEVEVNGRKTTLGAVASAFIKANPDLVELPFRSYGSALSTLQAAFPDALTVNGTNSKKVNLAAVEQFQTDNNGKNLIVVQADKGKEGISLHDTTGVHPRVMFNLGLPVKPTMSIQQEGRIYRTGQASNAMQRYMNTGTAWERYAFATTLARRASTAENLAMGEEARMLLDAFVQAYEDSDSYPAGHEGEGTGGKERDRAANSALTEWDRAVSYYFANQKKNSKTKAQEGTDYFATPEPLGLKMAEWADVLPGEAVLEPSAGHGAIAMWFPDQAKRRAIEPSLNLTSKLALRFDGDIVQGSFEDHNTINKYDAIVMNPPFGSSGKTAMEHVAKAAQHLKEHGRIVALIPSGPAMDKRFDKWLYEEKVEKVESIGKINEQEVYAGDTIEFYPSSQSAAHSKGKGAVTRITTISSTRQMVFFRNVSGTGSIDMMSHIKHIEPTGPREKRTTNPMQLTAEMLLPAATFERAGTSVSTRIVILDKDGEGQGVRRDYSRTENINDFFERIKDSEIPGRQHASQPNNDTTPVTVEQVQPDGTVTAGLQSDDFDLANFPHTQSGTMMYVATLNKRDAALYARALQVAKRNGGRYSKYSQGGAVAGFLFKGEASRDKFLQAMNGEATHVSIARDITYRPGTTAAEKQAAEELVRSTTTDAKPSAQGASAYAGRRNAGILSSAISTEIRRNGTVNFVGKQIASPEDLAAIAQVYRNPQYETLRYFFTKDNRIVGQLGVSSRLPGASKPFPGTMDVDDGTAWLQQRMADFGADGYYLLHNHPNGDVKVSDDDLNATREIVARVPGFKAHVVINHNIYNTIYKKDLVAGADRPAATIKQFKAGPDQVRTPGKPSPFLGSILHGTDELAALGKQIEVQDGNILFVVSSGNVGIVGLAEQPVNETPERIAAYVKRLALKTGGGHVFAVVPENTRKYLTADQEQALRAFAVTAVEQGYLIDAVMQGKSLVQGVENGQKHGVYFGKDLYGYHVSQSAWHNKIVYFSLNEDTESFTGLQAADVRKVMPWVNVVQSVNEVPEKVLADATAMGAKPWNIEGFIYEDKVWLVAENIKSISRAKVVAHVHELAHLGQDDKLVDLAVDWFNSTKGDATPFRQETHALLQEEAAKRNLDLNKPEDHRTAVREATARLAEDMAAKGLKPGLIQKIVNHLRELLRKLGRPLRVTDQELAGAVAEMLRLGEKRLSGADYSLQENRLNGQPTSGMIKEKEQDNGTESRNNAGNNSFFGKAQASHFKDAKALSGGIYFSIPEDARRSEVRDKETRALKEFAEQNGLMLDAAPMEREIELQGISGMDNFVYHKDGTYIKANKFTHAGTFSDLFVNITLHNKVFPEAPYIFEGFVNIHGMFRPVFSQPAFANDMAGEDQRRDLERLAADTLVSRDNFTRIDGDFKIVAQASFTRNDIVVSDINYRNVLHFNDEVIYFDPIVRLSDAARTRENLQSLLFDDQPSVQFSLRSEIQDAVKSIPWEDVVPTTKENWRRFFNPLDWSRSWGVIQDLTPEVIQAAIGDFFATPIAQAERDPAKAPYVAEGDARETDRMQIMLDMFDFNPGQKDTRSPKEKIVDAFTKLHSGQINTEWEKLNQRLFALKDLQRKAFDLIFVEGDAMGSEYASLAVARLNPRLAKAPGMNAEVFELYRDIRHHMDVTVAEARIKHMEELLKLMPEMTDKERERHIAEYRNQLRKVRGWMTRDHGKGRFQATVYHVFTAAELAEDWKAKELFDKDGEPSGMQYVLPYYPGNRVMEIIENRVKEGWQEAKAKVTTTDKGLVVITLTGAAESAMEDLGSVIDEQMKDNPIKVMTYMHRFETKLGAKAHRNLVAKDLKKAMPRTYIEGHRYEVAPVMVADDLSEELFQAVKGDIALEQILKKSLDNALKRGEIDKEKHTALHNELVQDVAEVLLSRAAGRYQIRRAPYLIEGYATEGVMSLYQDYITGVAGMLSKAKYAMKQYKHLEEAKAEVKPWATAYVFDTLRNMGLADRIGGDVRALASLWLMGFKLSSAMINATQPYTLGLAELKRRIPGQSAIKLITQAQGNIFTGKGLQQDEEAIFETAVYKHQEMIDAVSEVSGHNEGSFTKAGKLLHGLTGKSLALFQQVEILNRKTMILAAYRAYRAEGTPRGLIDEAALKMAMEVNSAVNFEMGRHNLPGFARKSAAGRTLYALQPYAWNSLNLIFNRLTSGETRDQIALLRYAGMMFLLAGATGLPGGDELDKLYRRLRGRSIKLDLQEWSAKHAAEYGTIGEMANGFAWYGMPSLVGINASNAMRLQMPIVSQLLADNSALEAVTGVPGALWNKMTTAATFAGRGAPMRAVEAAAPEFVAGPLRAARMYREGATTSHGKRIFDEEGQPLQYSAGDAVKRGLGFQPLKQSQRSALTEQMQALEKYWGKDQKDLIDAIRFAKDDDARDKAIDKVQEYNERLLESQALGLVTPITDSKIRNGLTYKPNRKQTGWKQQHSN